MQRNRLTKYERDSIFLRDILKSAYAESIEVVNIMDYLPTDEKPETQLITQDARLESLSHIYGRGIHTETYDKNELHICKCGNFKFVKNGKNTSSSQLYKCSSCKKSKVLSLNTFNIYLAFTHFYDKHYEEKLYMLGTKHEKIYMFTQPKYKTFFNANVQMKSKDNDKISPDEIFELSFYATCDYIDECSWRYLKKLYDDWFFFINYKDSDVTYKLEVYMIKMVRKYGVYPQLQQDMTAPLICCNNCGSYSIQRYNFNNNARRAIKCMECGKNSIIRVKNLITMVFFDQSMRQLFNTLTKDEKEITKLINHSRKDFYSSTMISILEAVLSKQQVVTHSIRVDLIKAFLTIQKYRIHMFLGGKHTYLAMYKLGDIQEDIDDTEDLCLRFIEEDNPNLYLWEEKVFDAFSMFEEKYQLKLLC